MPSRATALRTASGNLSSDSSGVCTPTTTSPAGPLLRSSDSTQARELRQFTHSKAQNSTSTTLPLSPASVRGAELIQSSARWWVNSDGALGAASATIDQAVSAASALRVIPFIYHPHKASFYSMNGRICVVTGATHGIGRATARALAASGATVLVHGRDHARARAVAEDISRDTGNPEVRFVQADFAQLAQVRRLAQQLHSLLPRLDVLINNAGMMAAAHARSADGYELTFAVNHLAPFLLTNLLLEKLKASAPARVIVVASEAHRRATLDFGDLMNAGASGWGAYQRSKLANVLFARELARRLAGTGVTVNALHPGLIRSQLFRGSPALLRALLSSVGWLFMLSPQQGARGSVYLATAPEVGGQSGGYYRGCRRAAPSLAAQSEACAARLWQESARLTGMAA